MSSFHKLVPDSERLLTEKEAAAVLGLFNSKTLANWRSKGKHPDLEYVRIGRAIRYRLGALHAFKAKHTVGASQEVQHA